MNTMIQKGFFRNLKKKVLSFLLATSLLLPMTIQLIPITDATVIDGAGNTLLGENGNTVNLSNSGSYSVDFSLDGTLDISDTVLVTAMDGSGKTATGTYVSASGGESSGSIALNLGDAGWLQGDISFSGVVYSGAIVTQVVASGITMSGTMDSIPSGIVLSSTAPSSISGAITITGTTSEVVSGFTLGDISVTSGTASAFSALSGTVYTFTVTPTVSTGTMTISVGSGVFSDTAGNTNTLSNTLSYTVNIPDTTDPLVAIMSHSSGATVTGSPTISGTATDAGGIASVTVNGLTATLGTGTWSKVVTTLVAGANTITVIATDSSGNTGSTSIIVHRVSAPSSINATLSGTTGAAITFATDLSATGVVRYGTNSGTLNIVATGSSPGTSHTFILGGLVADTTYYYTVEGQGGVASSIQQFKTPAVVDVTTASGSMTASSSVYLSGSTATGATFLGTGTLTLDSLTSNGSSLMLALSGLVIHAFGGNWDGLIQAPETTGTPVNFTLSGYAFVGNAYQIGNAGTELTFSGQLATVTVRIGSSYSGQTARIFRSINQGTTYTELSSCVVDGSGDCTFTTSQLSLFAFAVPADTVPNAFSFTAVTNAELSTQYTSNSITVSGINGATAISVIGGEYNINGGSYTSALGAVNTGDIITLRAFAAASYSTLSNTTLSIGGIASTFAITTKASTGGGGGSSSGPGGSSGGGGGGSSSSQDVCIGGDFSPSYYDGICTVIGGNVIGNPLNGMFNIPAIVIDNIANIKMRDISRNWAKEYIIRLVIRGIVDNVPFYHPNNNLTRAEFLKIVINTTGWEIPTQDLNIPFDDVTNNVWYARYVSLALSKGMITDQNMSFRPNYTITRAEATKILLVALGAQVTEPSVLYFKDLDVNSDLTKYVEAARYLNILDGQIINGRRIFRPQDSITRAEIAKIVVNTFHL